MAKATPRSTKTTAMVPWEEEMKGAAARAAKTETVTSITARIGTRGGVLTIDDEPVEGNELDVVVLAYVFENAKYEGPYNPSSPQVPSCYAFGDPEDSEDAEDDMKPHAQSDDPQGDEDGLCKGCEHNVFGSAATGRGKACKNMRRLAVVTEDGLEELADAQVRTLNLPPTSVKNWSKYVHKLADDFERPVWGVVTTIQITPDPKTQFQISFKFKSKIDFGGGLYEQMKARQEEVRKQLVTPYPTQESLDQKAAERRPVAAHGKLKTALAKTSRGAQPSAKAGAKRKF